MGVNPSYLGLLFKRFKKGDSLHKAVNAENFNKIFNILEDIQGEGCTIEKSATGLGWKIVVDKRVYGSDIEPLFKGEQSIGGGGVVISIITDSGIGYKADVLIGEYIQDENGEQDNKVYLPIYNSVNDLPSGTVLLALQVPTKVVGGSSE